MFPLHKYCCYCLQPKIAGLTIGIIELCFGIIQLIDAFVKTHILLLIAVIGITKMIVNSLLIKGILNDTKHLLLPWIIAYVFCIVLSLCAYINFIFFKDEKIRIFNIFWLIVTVVDIYFWFCIIGLFLKYIEDERRVRNNRNLVMISYDPEPPRMIIHNITPPDNSVV